MADIEPISNVPDACECFKEFVLLCDEDEASTLTCYFRELIDAKTKFKEAEAELLVKNGNLTGYNMKTRFKSFKNQK